MMTSDLRSHARLPVALLAGLALVTVGAGWSPAAGHLSFALEVGPGVLGIIALIATYLRLPLSHFVYAGVAVHYLILVYGGYYTYAETPLGNWAQQSFDLSRNHYDRVGHVALGLFPCFTIREVLLRQTPLQRGGWLTFLVLSVVLAVGAFWELLEWWTTLLVASDVGQAFLGSQGDPWDAHWDMLLALVGAAVGLLLLAKSHDRAMTRVPRVVSARG